MQQTAEKSERRGRPRLMRPKNERIPTSVRIRGSLFNELSKAAAANDWPLGREIEVRLERAALIEQFVGTAFRPLLAAISDFDSAGKQRAKELGVKADWAEHEECYRIAAGAAIRRILKQSPGPWDGKLWHTLLESWLLSVQQQRTGTVSVAEVQP